MNAEAAASAPAPTQEARALPPRLTRWLLVLAAVAFVSSLAASLLIVGAPGPQGASAGKDHRVYRQIGWDDLSPKEWDPTKKLRHPDGSLVSDLDPRARVMLEQLRAVWDNAPTVAALDGAAVRLPGYVVPLDESDGKLTAFLLVPYFGACIHTPPPPANQIVYVVPKTPVPGFRAMDVVWVDGVMSTSRQGSPMGVSGYRLDAVKVQPYRRPAEKAAAS